MKSPLLDKNNFFILRWGSTQICKLISPANSALIISQLLQKKRKKLHCLCICIYSLSLCIAQSNLACAEFCDTKHSELTGGAFCQSNFWYFSFPLTLIPCLGWILPSARNSRQNNEWLETKLPLKHIVSSELSQWSGPGCVAGYA